MTLDYMADYMAIICLNEHESIESNEWRGQESLKREIKENNQTAQCCPVNLMGSVEGYLSS